jgi:hypothetical protein
MLATLLLIVTFILVYLNLKNIIPYEWPMYFMDEYINHRKTWIMLDAIKEFNIVKLFGSGGYGYGFIYSFIVMGLNTYFIINDQTTMMQLIPRIITIIAILISIFFMHKIVKKHLNPINTILFCLITISFPIFWARSSAGFFPDWVLNCFLIISIYYLEKDRFKFSKNFLLASLFLGLGISFKLQGLILLPLLVVYIAQPLTSNLNIKTITNQAKLLAKSFGIVFLAYFIGNPYVIHPVGLIALKRQLTLGINEQSNAIQEGYFFLTSILEKTISYHFMNQLFFLALIVILCISTYSFFTKKAKSIFPIIAISCLTCLSYLMIIAKMNAGRYYLPIIIIATLTIIPYLSLLPSKKQKNILLAILVIQITLNFNHYKKIASPCYSQKFIKIRTENNQLIINTLKNKITNKTHILVSPMASFNYQALKLNHTQIHTLFGSLSDWMLEKEKYKERYSAQGNLKIKVFHKKDYIIFQKPKTVKELVNPMLAKIFSGQLGYKLIAENETIWIFENTIY